MPSREQIEKGFQGLTPGQSGILGIASGAIEVTVLQPMLYWKNMSQQGLGFSLNPKLVYRGLGVSVMNMSILTGLQFPLTNTVTGIITGGKPRELSNSETIFSAWAGGTISGLACGPMELIMIQQQRFGGSILSTPMKLISEFGASQILRGVVTACGREGLFCAGYLGMGPVFTKELSERNILEGGAAKAGGAIGAGVIAASLSHPMDTIKTCMQGDMGRTNYGSILQTASKILRDSGPLGFFRGWGWRTGRMICAVFLLSECKIILSPLLFPETFADL